MIIHFILLLFICDASLTLYPFLYNDRFSSSYGALTKKEIENAKRIAREMFYFAYDNYMQFAFPMDELDPINCTGRGHDHQNPSNLNINDVLGDYCLTLVESLDALVVFGNKSEFHRAVKLVIENVSFERNVTVQVFEATIRVIGSLLSAHLILTDPTHMLGDFDLHGYNNELLTLARDLAGRLLFAFEGTKTGLPFPRVNLLTGVNEDTINETCTAGAGSLLVEFGILSRLLDDDRFESLARRAVGKLWSLRNNETGLLGNVVNIQTGQWSGVTNGLGAGLDSYYEYLLKSFILFGNQADLDHFKAAQESIMKHLRRGREDCVHGKGEPPIFVNIDMRDGSMINTWIDALQASFPALLVLNGDVEEAVCLHALFYALWVKYGALPERYNWFYKKPDVFFYPLRPELAESTYMLYRATLNPFYLHVGLDILYSLNAFTKVKCGYATIHNVVDKTLEDRMESFFISETVKYLFLLFDFNNVVNHNEVRILFTTEGHIIPINERLRKSPIKIFSSAPQNSSCNYFRIDRDRPPLDEFRFNQMFHLAGIL